MNASSIRAKNGDNDTRSAFYWLFNFDQIVKIPGGYNRYTLATAMETRGAHSGHCAYRATGAAVK
jgi:hypothetical protein